jgi:hypothetical protein
VLLEVGFMGLLGTHSFHEDRCDYLLLSPLILLTAITCVNVAVVDV